MSELLVRIIKLTFIMIALVIGIHNCLTLSKMFTFYVVYGIFMAVTKSLKSCLSWKSRSGPHSGCGWENPNRWSTRD